MRPRRPGGCGCPTPEWLKGQEVRNMNGWRKRRLWHIEEVGPDQVKIVEDVEGGLAEWYRLTGETYENLVREQEKKGKVVIEESPF